uniref:Ovule protein n=1 Tax=Caenorhabditis tropicalis TaxID=1561998 RepID=A0A1I7UFI3_9PELO
MKKLLKRSKPQHLLMKMHMIGQFRKKDREKSVDWQQRYPLRVRLINFMHILAAQFLNNIFGNNIWMC